MGIMLNKRKLVCGVGVNDSDYKTRLKEPDGFYSNGTIKYRIVWSCPFYQRWVDMLKRGYSTKLKNRHTTYIDVSVCEEWHLFSTFKAWMETQDWEGKCLDKDILIKNNKIYSPDFCCFVDQRVNKFILEGSDLQNLLPIGVHKESNKNKFTAACANPFTNKPERIGYYDCPEEAHLAWLSRKLFWAKELAKDILDKRVAEALIKRYENYAG